MALMPKRVKYRKSQRGRIRGNAVRGNTVAFGDFGLQSLDRGTHVRRMTIEACRVAANQYIRGEGKLYIRIFPQKSVTARPLETRMGHGKGEPDHWVAVVKPGTVLFELGGVDAGHGPRVFCAGGLQAARPRAVDGPCSNDLRNSERATRNAREAMTKATHLREMSADQLEFTLTEAKKELFRLRFQAATEKLDAPSNLRKLRREIARIYTIQHERATDAAKKTKKA